MERTLTRLAAKGNRLRGFTLAEMIVVVTILTILIILTFTAAKTAVAMSARTICAGNLRQLGIAFYSYAADHNNSVPPSQYDSTAPPGYTYDIEGGWYREILPYVDNNIQFFRCPSSTATIMPMGVYGDYCVNCFVTGVATWLGHLSKFPTPSETCLLTEGYCETASPDFASSGNYYRVNGVIHQGLFNVCYLDGHVQTMPNPPPFSRYNAFWSYDGQGIR